MVAAGDGDGGGSSTHSRTWLQQNNSSSGSSGSSRKEAFFAAPAAFSDHSDPDPEHARARMGHGPIGVGLDPVGPRTRIAFIVYLSTSDKLGTKHKHISTRRTYRVCLWMYIYTSQACKEGSGPGEEGLISRCEIKARSPPQAAPSNSAARGGRQTQFNGYKPSL